MQPLNQNLHPVLIQPGLSAERMAADDSLYYYKDEEGAFTSIRDDQPFYINAQGHVVVVFEKYEIAPGYMGIQEFEVLPEA